VNNPVTASPIFGVGITVLVYSIALALHRRWRWMHPLLITCGVLIVLLRVTRIPYAAYNHGGEIISFFLGPATIALGVPFYKQSRRIGRHVLPIVLSVTIGAATGLSTAWAFVKLAHGSDEVARSMLPKSVTTPISIELSRQLGGTPELSAVFTVLAGLIGSVVGPMILRAFGVRRDIPLGLAMGTSAHGIGTARVVQESELQGGSAGFAMALAGIVTAILSIPVQWWLNSH
jgi:predicted murein hydrolase (TIGR00659 family)